MSYLESQKERAAWLANLKPGDKAVIPGRWEDPGSLVVVERLTATQIVLVGGTRYRRDGGSPVSRGSAWHSPYLQPVTAEFLAAKERSNLLNWMRGLNPRDLSLEQLRAVKKAVTEVPEAA